jgi:predicted NUDIX family NTP pyrophosphohydrolase
MPLLSAGLLIFRRSPTLQVLLLHPGGPYYKNKDAGSWTIPKGLANTTEDPLSAAMRECREETGLEPLPPFYPLPHIRLKSGKLVYAWACESNFDITQLKSNTFDCEWPPHSGKKQSFPEIDRALWLEPEQALLKINEAQKRLITDLMEQLRQNDGNLF